jgi:transposase
LDVRPIFLHNGPRTKGHVLVAMLALKLTRLFEERLHQAFGTTDDDPHALTFDDALLALSRISYLCYEANGHRFARLPQLDEIPQLAPRRVSSRSRPALISVPT